MAVKTTATNNTNIPLQISIHSEYGRKTKEYI